MPNTFSKWIDKKLSLPLPKWDQEPPLPTLPPTRPRVLTPSPSRETLTSSAASATSTSAFFQTLPFEIRHKILKEAFGPQTPARQRQKSATAPATAIKVQHPEKEDLAVVELHMSSRLAVDAVAIAAAYYAAG
ncbi:hypothetical protein V499_09185 [Pseudogymnoascus sp. VKM F-103]|nr:hypothetical protein V499_09185 [Pseudogymnoascus sp. VKM F-103]